MSPTRINNPVTVALISIFVLCLCFHFSELKVNSVNEAGEAQQAIDRAEKLRSNWTKASLQEALVEYEKAALLWTSASDFSRASQATLDSGDIHFLFSDYREALKRFQEAEALADKAGDWLAKANAMSRIGRLQSFTGDNELAQQQLTKALDLFKQHEADRSEVVRNAHGETLGNLAEVNSAKGDFIKARQLFKSALELIKNDPGRAAKIHLFNGYITGSLGDSEKARDEISHAADLYRQVNDKIGEARTLVALGLAHIDNFETDRAIELHTRAIQIFRTAGDRHGEAITLNALGASHDRNKQFDLSINVYEQALRLFEAVGSVEGVATAAFQLGTAHEASGHSKQALALYERALRLSRAAGTVRTEIHVLAQIALLNGLQGRRELALAQYQKVLSFYAGNDRRARAIALNGYATFLLLIKDNKRALETCLEVLPLSEGLGDRSILTATLYNFSRAHLALGSLDEALTVIRRSLGMIEDLRADVSSPDVRLSYLSGARNHYELCIEILMQLDSLRPGQGFASEALLVSERGRARLLTDLILESRSGSRQGATQELLDRDRELRKSLQMQAEYRMELFLNKEDPAAIAEVDNQLAQLKADYQANEAKIREQNPRLFEPPPALSLQQLQNDLRVDDTMLLEYTLGDEHSYLWAATANSFQSFQLPPRKIIEDAARELYQLMTARQATEGGDDDYAAKVNAADEALRAKARELSRMLLGPVAERLGTRKLLVVTEGALQFISFESLPTPVSESDLVIKNNQVVVLPSISALMAIRSRGIRTTSSSKLLAVIADPVFSSVDERVQDQTVARGITLAATGDAQRRNGGLARLNYASEEADKISAAAPLGTTLVAKGFDATRETAMSSDIGKYKIVHFATHGFLDSQHPELSSIVLSTVDRNGNKTNGVMPLHDIYSLNLSAELTVLSACQTALGKDIKGEGLVGLTHSFMSAGSNTVVATLWKVDDRATSVLMADFYHSMLQKGMPPAEALRAAKLKLMQEPRWREPYYWAGFVVQGEYRNRIEVGRGNWFRSGVIVLSSVILIAAALLIYKRRKRRRLSPRSN